MKKKTQQVDLKHCASCCSHLTPDGYCTNSECKLNGKSQDKDHWAKDVMDELMSNKLAHTDCESCACHNQD